MNTYISQINNLLVTQFPPKWAEQYNFHLDEVPDLASQQRIFQEKLESIRKDIFVLFNSSILTGEYCQKNYSIDDLNSITFTLNQIETIIPPSPPVQDLILKELNLNFVMALNVAIAYYTHLLFRINNRFNIDNREFVHASNPEIENKLTDKEFDETVEKELNFLEVNVRLVIVDFELRPTTEYFKDLTQISEDLKYGSKLSSNVFSILLGHKCEYLLGKWMLRKEHMDSKAIYSLINNVELELRVENFGIENPILKHWRKYIETHYELDPKWKAETTRAFGLVKNTILKDASLFVIHKLIKYYKDIDRNILNLSEIKDEVNRRFELAKNDPNDNLKYVLAIALNYSFNNHFSLLLENRHLPESTVENAYQEVLNVQSKTDIDNFFVQFKYLGYLISKLEELYAKRQALESLQPARAIISKCEDVFKEYEKNVQWSRINYNYAFLLPFEESVVEVNNSKIKHLHFFSSFVLPLPSKQYSKEFNEYKQKLFSLKSSIEIFENIEKEIAEFHVLKKEVQQKEIKSMEIIAIFTAIVTFVAVSIPSFQFIRTPYQAALFMFALSSSLSFFVLLLLTLTRGISRWKQNIVFLSGLVIVMVAAWAGLILYTEDPVLKPNAPETKISTPSESDISSSLKAIPPTSTVSGDSTPAFISSKPSKVSPPTK